MGVIDRKRKNLIIMHELCNGCGLCEIICALEHEGYINRACSRIRTTGGLRPFPQICLQCDQPLCLENCPVSAIERSASTGLLTVDDERCISCRCCVITCPFGGTREDCEGRMVRCDLCGGEPECTAYCPTGALSVSTVQDAAGRKRRLFASNADQCGDWD